MGTRRRDEVSRVGAADVERPLAQSRSSVIAGLPAVAVYAVGGRIRRHDGGQDRAIGAGHDDRVSAAPQRYVTDSPVGLRRDRPLTAGQAVCP